MFRPSLRAPRRLFTATAAASAAAVVLQEREKPSIYPNPDREIVLQETPTLLEAKIGVARRTTTDALADARARVQGVVSQWIGVEHAVEHRVKAIIAPNEPLTPGLLYVGIAALSGSVLARNRFLFTRLALPPLLGAFALNHFLPATAHNLGAYLAELEEAYFPEFAAKHAIANAHTRMTVERVREASAGARERLARGVEGAVGRVQEATGLRLRETLGWGDKEAGKVEAQVSAVVQAAEKKWEEVKAEASHASAEAEVAADKKTEEVKRLV